jgi:peptide/nickel transport system substrate-binding protein
MSDTDRESTTVESPSWERPLDRRELLVKAAVAGGTLAGGGMLASGATAARRAVPAYVRRRGAAATLFVANYGDMQNLDPHTSSADTVTGDILTNLYSIPATFVVPRGRGPGGIQYANPNAFRGQAVQGWKTEKGGTQVLFTVRKGIKFPDGTALDATAIKYSLDRCLDVKAVGSFLFAMVGITSKDQFELLDNSHLRFHLPKPTSLLFGNMAMFYGSAILNPSIVKQHATSSDPTAQGWLKTHAAESGWYTLKDWNVGSGWTLEANPDFWEPVRTKTVQFQVVPDAQQRELLIRSGKVDMALNIPIKDVPALRNDGNVHVLSVPSRSVAWAGFDVTQKPFDNKLVRQAILYAIPYATIMREVMHGQGVQLKSPIPKGTPGANFGYWDYNTDYAKAKSLLAKAGYAKGFSTQLDIQTGNPVDEQTASWIAQGLQKIGIDVTINKQPAAAFTAQLQAKKHKFWFSSTSWISINNDPLYHLYWLFAQSCCTYGGYQPRSVVARVNAFVNRPLRDPARIRAVNQLQRQIVDDAPWVFLFQPPWTAALRKNVSGFVYYSSDQFIRYGALAKS